MEQGFGVGAPFKLAYFGSSGESSCFFSTEFICDWWSDLPGSCSLCRGVPAEWGHLVTSSCSQALLSGPSVVTIPQSQGFLGSVRQICSPLHRGLLSTRQLRCGGPFVGGSPGNTSPGDGSHTDYHWRGALEPQHMPFSCRWSKAGAASLSLPSLPFHLLSAMQQCAEIFWPLTPPLISFIVMGLSSRPFLLFH